MLNTLNMILGQTHIWFTFSTMFAVSLFSFECCTELSNVWQPNYTGMCFVNTIVLAKLKSNPKWLLSNKYRTAIKNKFVHYKRKMPTEPSHCIHWKWHISNNTLLHISTANKTHTMLSRLWKVFAMFCNICAFYI